MPLKKLFPLLSLLSVGIALCGQVAVFNPSLYAYGGFPQMNDTHQTEVQILSNIAYVSGYSEHMKNPLWVVYKLVNQADRDTCYQAERRSRFLIDKRTETRVKHDDYTHSGYDRGHMAPNAAILCWFGESAQRETYLMSNVVPQQPELNQQLWEELEAKIRKDLSRNDFHSRKGYDLFITTGPVFSVNNKDSLPSGIPVPDKFYKVIVFKKGRWAATKSIAVVIPQFPQSQKLETYITTVDEIEAMTHINFFPDLSDWRQKRLESRKRNFKLQVESDE